MKRALIITGVLATAIGVTALSAQARGFGPGGPGGAGGASFSELDADGDGLVTAAEMEAFGKSRFEQTDTDGDGFVTLEEMQAHMLKEAEARFAKHGDKMLSRKDANGDGKLSFEEMRPSEKRQEKMLGRIDTNGDGAISQSEFDEARAKMRDHRRNQKGDKPEQN